MPERRRGRPPVRGAARRRPRRRVHRAAPRAGAHAPRRGRGALARPTPPGAPTRPPSSGSAAHTLERLVGPGRPGLGRPRRRRHGHGSPRRRRHRGARRRGRAGPRRETRRPDSARPTPLPLTRAAPTSGSPLRCEPTRPSASCSPSSAASARRARRTSAAQSWLPDWRPDRDYRESYSARLDEGGVLRDLVHEIDYADGPVRSPHPARRPASTTPAPSTSRRSRPPPCCGAPTRST